MSTTTTEKKEYAKKYIRLELPRNFKITPRVLAINSEICRNPLIRKDQLREKFLEIPERVFDQIESNLFHNGFHARPKQQKELHPAKGSAKTYLNPESLGLQLHYAFFKDPVPVPKFTQDNKYRTWNYMHHKHNETTMLLNFQAGAKTRQDVSFFTEPELWLRDVPNDCLNQPAYEINDYPELMAHDFIAHPPEQIGEPQPKAPLELRSHIDWAIRLPRLDENDNKDNADDPSRLNQFLEKELTTVTIRVSTQPDGYFAHQHNFTKEYFFFECDEGTETILPGERTRQSILLFAGSSLFAKYATYITAYRKWAHQKQFGISSFSVITVTTTPERVQEIIKKLCPVLSAEPLNIHPEFFLFTDRQTLAEHDDNPYHPKLKYKNLAGKDFDLVPE